MKLAVKHLNFRESLDGDATWEADSAYHDEHGPIRYKILMKPLKSSMNVFVNESDGELSGLPQFWPTLTSAQEDMNKHFRECLQSIAIAKERQTERRKHTK